MEPHDFLALVTEETAPGQFSRTVRRKRVDELPPGELLVKVHYSSLNYKDALSALGRPGVTRKYPHTPGIDAAGEVASCSDGVFAPGDQVIVTGYDLGMNTPGGYGQYIRVPSSWAVRLPDGLTVRESMALGTAGLTAALCLRQLINHGVRPEHGEVLVTGASGGVGSIAVALLAGCGYSVTAASGKPEQEPVLKALGATQVIGREELLAGADRPLMKERWGGVVDVVGGDILAAAVKSTRYGGVVTCCGLAASPQLPMTVFPFILRAVTLIGIDSAQCPAEVRKEVWSQLAGPWKPQLVLEKAVDTPLESLEEQFTAMVEGRHSGRTVVELFPS